MNPYDIPSDEEDEAETDKENRTFARKVNHVASSSSSSSSHATKAGPFQHPCVTTVVTNTAVHDSPLSRKVGYVFSKQLLSLCDRMVQIRGRARLVHSLIASYGLLRSERVSIIDPAPASYDDLVSFHDSTFVNYLREMNSAVVDEEDDVDEEGETFGLMYDCPPVRRIYDFVLRNVGSSLSAARALTSGRCGVAINWFGGWHHAQRDRAAGFCYANDVVIAIQELKKTFGKVLYVDLDLHHGDGVQEAFRHTDSVATVSLHKFEPGFFPGTGALGETGLGDKGAGCCVNVPLKDGIADDKYLDVFERVVTAVLTSADDRRGGFVARPGAVVVQCGADGIIGDPHRAFNLTPRALVGCVRLLTDRVCPGVPTLLLGGGGYNHANTAKCWTLLTAAVLGRDVPDDIPEECPLFDHFGPDFTIDVTPGYIPDENSDEYLRSVVESIKSTSNSGDPS